MCGICGIYSFNGPFADENLLRKMNDTMTHRGPDGDGIYVGANIGLGHRRLSIIDLEGGRQPMSDEAGTVQVVFNGEIYNYIELKEKLSAKGYRFRTRCDTETIIYAYMEWGDRFVDQLRGMFAIGLWDASNQKLVLVRDRVGKKPLYYCCGKDRILFASEMKALLADPAIPRDIDYYALDAYFSFGYVPSPMSILKSIRKLPPAHLAVHNGKSMQVREYWRLDMQEETDSRPEDEMAAELESVFDEAVNLRLMSDVPLGAFLSGGIDSSAVVASMALKMREQAVKTVSIGFSDKRFDELQYARVMADRYQTDHAEFVVKPAALNVLPDIVWHLDEPFADSSAIPTYYVSKMARQRVTVVLSGDGGDEVFAGYIKRYNMNRLEDKIRSHIPEGVRKRILAPMGRVYPKFDFLPRPLRLKHFLNNLSRSYQEAYFRDMSFGFMPEMKQELYRPDFAASVREFDVFQIFKKHFAENPNHDPVTRSQYVDIKTYLPEDILVKVDRMSMANSLEVRSPILDHRLMEIVGKMPSRVKIKKGKSKYIFKRVMSERLPAAIMRRGKQGFSVPLGSWLRGELKELLADTVLSPESRSGELLNQGYIRDLWKKHSGGKSDYGSSLWSLLMFELWHRRFLN